MYIRLQLKHPNPRVCLKKNFVKKNKVTKSFSIEAEKKENKKDIYQILMYAILGGVISLSLPLGIQSIVNFIQAGKVSTSWIVLVIMVVIGVAFVGILKIMQYRITENLQQKIFVRSSFEFAYRFPKIKFNELHNQYPPELANRFFDTL